jgi:hypothetical protein
VIDDHEQRVTLVSASVSSANRRLDVTRRIDAQARGCKDGETRFDEEIPPPRASLPQGWQFRVVDR